MTVEEFIRRVSSMSLDELNDIAVARQRANGHAGILPAYYAAVHALDDPRDWIRLDTMAQNAVTARLNRLGVRPDAGWHALVSEIGNVCLALHARDHISDITYDALTRRAAELVPELRQKVAG